MAWGLWNKIKQGIKKAGTVIKKAAKVVTDKVIKPFKPVITAAASAFSPVAGAIAGKALDAVERFSDEGFGGGTRDVNEMAQKAASAVSWAKNRWG